MLPEKDFIEVIKNTPLISIDLIIKNDQGDILLGKRTNPPAKGYWFVPGGRIYKNELLKDACERITKDELGAGLALEHGRLIGIFDHIYDDNFLGTSSFNTHYVVIAYEYSFLTLPDFSLPLLQHKEFRFFTKNQLLNDREVHNYTKNHFLKDSRGILNNSL